MTSSSNRALDFIEDMHPLLKSLVANNYVKFTPHYVFWECLGCE